MADTSREESCIEWLNPAYDHLMQIFNGYRGVLAIIPALELGIFDKVGSCADGISSEQMATDNGWHAENTERLMNAMAAHGLLNKSNTNPAVFTNTGSGELLMSKKPGSCKGFYVMFSKVLAQNMSGIAEEVKTGKHSGQPHWHSHEEPGKDGKGDHFHGKDKGNSAFLYNVMNAMMLPYVENIVSAFDLSRYKSAVDIGGGSGLLSFALSRRYPEMEITLLEMGSVIAIAKESFLPPDFEKLNVKFMEGNCFEVDLPVADLYVISKVIHHFSEEKIDQLLTNLYSKLPKGGSILILEDVFNSTKTGSATAYTFDLFMMSKGIGKNRSFEEYAEIFERNNFKKIRCIRTNKECTYDMILATK